jgi:hypothetical protein
MIYKFIILNQKGKIIISYVFIHKLIEKLDLKETT